MNASVLFRLAAGAAVALLLVAAGFTLRTRSAAVAAASAEFEHTEYLKRERARIDAERRAAVEVVHEPELVHHIEKIQPEDETRSTDYAPPTDYTNLVKEQSRVDPDPDLRRRNENLNEQLLHEKENREGPQRVRAGEKSPR